MKKTYHLSKAKRLQYEWFRETYAKLERTEAKAWERAESLAKEQVEVELAAIKQSVESELARHRAEFEAAVDKADKRQAECTAVIAETTTMGRMLKLLIAGNPEEQIAYLESQFKVNGKS